MAKATKSSSGTVNAMNLTVKAVKVNKRLSRETDCFSASIYLDGKKVGTVINEGSGGPNFYEWSSQSQGRDIEAFAKSIGKFQFGEGEDAFELSYDLDLLIEDIICGETAQQVVDKVAQYNASKSKSKKSEVSEVSVSKSKSKKGNEMSSKSKSSATVTVSESKSKKEDKMTKTETAVSVVSARDGIIERLAAEFAPHEFHLSSNPESRRAKKIDDVGPVYLWDDNAAVRDVMGQLTIDGTVTKPQITDELTEEAFTTYKKCVKYFLACREELVGEDADTVGEYVAADDDAAAAEHSPRHTYRVPEPELGEVSREKADVTVTIRTIGGNTKNFRAMSFVQGEEVCVVETKDTEFKFRRARTIDVRDVKGEKVRRLRIPADAIVRVG